jgi:predicted DNA-binding transcriptional regulator YafY
MESSAERLLALLSLFQSRPQWSAAELAERLSVTPRTVRRDVARLRALGYPVDAETGPTGGYQLGTGGRLPPLLLTDDEAVAVTVGLRVAAGGGVSGFEEAAVSGLAKLEQVLPVRLRDRVDAMSTSTVMLAPPGGPAVSADVLLTLAQGCRRPERMTFEYRDSARRVTDRRVEPFRLVNAETRWYLVALDLDRRDWRTFRVDRMSRATLTGHRFTRESEPDAGAMVAEGLALAPYSVQAEVLLRIDIREAAELVPRTVGALEAVDGGTLMRLGANELDWIARFVAGLPCDAEVRSPDELRTALRLLGRRLQRSHARSGPRQRGPE